MNWRDHIKVHPAAELFPMMSDAELVELGKNIRANSIIITKIAYYKGKLLDGRNRLEAMEREGINLDWANLKDSSVVYHLEPSIDPYEYVISANLHRRHLTGAQKRELIDKVLKAKPEQSDASIAKQTKTSDKTVDKRRRKLESTSEIPRLEKTVGKDGKKRGRPAKPKTSKAPAAEPVEHRTTGSAEISIDQRKAEMAALVDPPADDLSIPPYLDRTRAAAEPLATTTPETTAAAEVDEVDRRVECVTNTILRHVGGLSSADTKRFFAALRKRINDAEHDIEEVRQIASEAA